MKYYKLIFYSILFALLFPLVSIADNYVIINQVMYDTPLNEEIDKPHACNGEYIELYNAGTENVNLAGWQLKGDGTSETWTFTSADNLSVGGYLIIACRRGSNNEFELSDLFGSLVANSTIIYQNKIMLANDGETLTLCNAANDTIDQMYYDGHSHLTKPGRIYAENPGSISNGAQCVSLHRTWVEFDEDGKAVSGTDRWRTTFVSFGVTMLPYNTYYEEYPLGGQSLPTGDNYIVTIEPLDPTTRVNIHNGRISLSNGIRARTTLNYLDGLGRQEQAISMNASPGKRDIVSTIEYCDKRNVSRQWLPVSVETEGQRVSIADIHAQAQTDYEDDNPYSETQYENSARKRPVAQIQPGETYNNYPSTQTYGFNSGNEQVLIYTVADSSLHTDGAYYGAATLYKNTVADEEGKSVITYTDKQGKKIMEERDGNRTYYVYDDIGRLRYVLPHISSSELNNGTYTLRNPIIRAAAYYYQYDNRGNMIYKRLPGCEPQYMVYDKLGQLVLKQDGNQRLSEKWTMFAYDSIGRTLYMAEIKLAQKSHTEMLDFFADKWQVEHYGNNHSFPLAETGYASRLLENKDIDLLTIYYYDNYDYLDILLTPMRQAIRFTEESGYGLPHDNATGLLTGTRIYNLSEKREYTSVSYYYDTKGRIVQSRSARTTDSYRTATSTEYLFDGSVAQQLSIQGTDSALTREHYRYVYDHVGRRLKTYYQLNNDEEIQLSAFSYDSIGRLAQNLLHNNRDAIRYTYDIRSMLTETRNKHFSERLFYADSLSLASSSATPCHNGNIAAMRVARPDTAFTFIYAYDGQNRLTDAGQAIGTGSSYSERYTYTAVGNIQSLKRFVNNQKIDDLYYTYTHAGNQLLSITDSGQDYDRYETIEYHNGATQADTTMRYDGNGNLIYDADRGISVIRYNILNLPDTIQFINGNQIVNLYDATGKKYRSVVYTNLATAVSPSYDIEHYTYETDSIEYRIVEYSGNIETYIGADSATIRRIHNGIGYYEDSIYYHYIKDHLGNICAVVNSAKDSIIQSTIYYASGVPMVLGYGRDRQPYLYNSKEFVEAHGLNTYDYGFRGYYAPIGRFTTIDPLAEQTPWQSPYSYAGNNFTNNIDWMGLGGFASGLSASYMATSWGVWGTLVDILNYIIVDEDGIVLEADLTNIDKGVYQVNRAAFEKYVDFMGGNGNHLLYAQIFGTQIGVHREMKQGAVFPGMSFDKSWYNLSETLGIIYSSYFSIPDFTPDPITGKIHPAEMPYNSYKVMSLDNQGQIQSMDQMQYYNSFERGMITNHVIQGVAVGGLGIVTLESTLLIYSILQYNVTLQFGLGLMEGFGKGVIETGPYTPYLYDKPIYQFGSEIGSQFYDFISRYL